MTNTDTELDRISVIDLEKAYEAPLAGELFRGVDCATREAEQPVLDEPSKPVNIEIRITLRARGEEDIGIAVTTPEYPLREIANRMQHQLDEMTRVILTTQCVTPQPLAETEYTGELPQSELIPYNPATESFIEFMRRTWAHVVSEEVDNTTIPLSLFSGMEQGGLSALIAMCTPGRAALWTRPRPTLYYLPDPE